MPRDAAALAWMANLACLELHPHPVRADDLDHPDELRVDLDPVPGVEWAQVREVAARRPRDARRLRARRLAEDVGLARHARLRAHRAALDVRPRCAAPRWRWRARSSGARRRSPRASGGRKSATASSSTTTRTPRTARSPRAYSVRPTPDARVSAPLDVGRGRRLRARATSRWRRCRRGSPRSAIATPASIAHAVLARARCSSSRRGTSARASATRRGRRTTRSSRASRRACSRRDGATPKHPLIEIGRAQKKDDALAGLERWKARHPEAAAHLEPADVLVDAMRGRFRTWTRIRVNLQHVPEALRPAQEALDPDDDARTTGAASADGRPAPKTFSSS